MARPVGKKRKSYRTTKYKYKNKKRKPLGRHRGKRRRAVSGRKRGGTWARGRKRRSSYAKVRRTVKRHRRKGRTVRKHRRDQYVRLNPVTALKRMVKDGVYTFGGILGIRALCHVLEEKVFKGNATFATGAMATIAPVLPAAVAMLLAALAPKVIKGSPRLVQGLQAGATLVFFDSVLTAVLKSVDPGGGAAKDLLPGASVAPMLLPAQQGYGMNEYVSSPMGLEVESAMALDEYVAAPSNQLGMGGDFDVEEALAGNEPQAFETGYAGGTLAQTVFSNF